MELQEALRRRKMVRSFRREPVPEDVIDRVLASVVHAPSAGFTQGNEFLVLSSEAAVADYVRITEHPDYPLTDADREVLPPVVVIPLSNKSAYVDRYSQPDKIEFGLDAAERWPVPYWDIDAGMASMLILLVAVECRARRALRRDRPRGGGAAGPLRRAGRTSARSASSTSATRPRTTHQSATSSANKRERRRRRPARPSQRVVRRRRRRRRSVRTSSPTLARWPSRTNCSTRSPGRSRTRWCSSARESGDERNGMTTSWVTQLSMEPVLIGVGVDNDAVTHRLISEGGAFTVNLWDAEDTRVFVKFSKPATDDGSTLNGRPVRTATTGAPGVRGGDRVDGLRGASTPRSRDAHAVHRRGRRCRHPRRRRPPGLDERHPHEVRRRQAPLTLIS